jgi:hypothetical protein
MRVYQFEPGSHGAWARMVSDLLEAPVIHTGEWQAMDTSKSDLHATHELEDVTLSWDRVPSNGITRMVPHIDGMWAAEHFRERVSGKPLNPAPSHLRWPYAVRGNAMHTSTPYREGDASPIATAVPQFDHTYPERFWPKHAGHNHGEFVKGWADPVSGVRVLEDNCTGQPGIRFNYGDLDDVVNLLVRSPLTRQAFLPVWFPEDTGAVDKQRVPCTIGYHFMQRGGRLSCRYYLRSCEVYRHLANDIFFAVSLMNWICDQVYVRTTDTPTPIRFRPGSLVMHISSLHAFVADVPKIKARLAADDDDAAVWPV